jgi:hypothetical protein
MSPSQSAVVNLTVNGNTYASGALTYGAASYDGNFMIQRNYPQLNTDPGIILNQASYCNNNYQIFGSIMEPGFKNLTDNSGSGYIAIQLKTSDTYISSSSVYYEVKGKFENVLLSVTESLRYGDDFQLYTSGSSVTGEDLIYGYGFSETYIA